MNFHLHNHETYLTDPAAWRLDDGSTPDRLPGKGDVVMVHESVEKLRLDVLGVDALWVAPTAKIEHLYCGLRLGLLAGAEAALSNVFVPDEA